MNRLHIGTMGWSYNFWLGNFYPKRLTAAQFLTEYSKHFNTVEVDRTFYGVPYESTVLSWKTQTPQDFLFSLKFPKVITHEKMLKNCEEEASRFIERVSLLNGKLGPLLIQLPPAFETRHLDLLRDFLSSLPEGYRFIVEVRNKKLMEDNLYTLLREYNAALALVDHPFLPELSVATSDFAYIRWEGDRRKVKGTLGKDELDRGNDIKKWAEKIEKLLDNSTEVFGYFSKYYSGHPPSNATQLLTYLQH